MVLAIVPDGKKNYCKKGSKQTSDKDRSSHLETSGKDRSSHLETSGKDRSSHLETSGKDRPKQKTTSFFFKPNVYKLFDLLALSVLEAGLGAKVI